jgi:energy-coupling factor transporter ATP-binding protein EcfA2
MLRPLTKANVEKHLGVLGLEAEFATHAHIRGLSGGQKVKVVLAACTWNQPHILVMDEPTNYLDRDSLGALAGAIREFGGGVVIISHHNEFTTALCPEKWTVADGKCVVTGAPQVSFGNGVGEGGWDCECVGLLGVGLLGHASVVMVVAEGMQQPCMGSGVAYRLLSAAVDRSRLRHACVRICPTAPPPSSAACMSMCTEGCT